MPRGDIERLTPDLLSTLRLCIKQEFIPGPYELREETVEGRTYYDLLLDGHRIEVITSDNILAQWQETSSFRFEAVLLRLLKGILWHSRYHFRPVRMLGEQQMYALSQYCMDRKMLPPHSVWNRMPYSIPLEDGRRIETPEAVVVPLESNSREGPSNELMCLIRGMLHGHVVFTEPQTFGGPVRTEANPLKWEPFNPPVMSFLRPEAGWP